MSDDDAGGSNDALDDRQAPWHGVSAAIRKQLLAEAGGRCSFPKCDAAVPDVPLHLAHIVPLSSRGPRGVAGCPRGDPNGRDNLIVLCPAHHLLVDSRPEEFTANALRQMWRSHVGEVGASLLRAEAPKGATPVAEALEFWREHREEPDEQLWHEFFAERPAILNLMVPGAVLVWHSKCYVGGKQLTNTGGDLLDFLAQGRGNATLLEIKTPVTALVGGRYRENVWKPSGEVIGATMQVLGYRLSLLQNSHALDSGLGLKAPDPACLVLLGDLEKARLGARELRSFEIFRQALRGVVVLTYDEFFGNLQAIQDLLSSELTEPGSP